MQQFVQHYGDFDFDCKMGTPHAQIQEKYDLTDREMSLALDYYAQGNNLELEKLLSQKTTHQANPLPPVLVLEPEEKPEFGYSALPLRTFLFVKPLPVEHRGRLLIPKAYESSSDMGFVHEVGIEVQAINKGDLVLYDKYAEVGNRFELVDDTGEIVSLVQMREDNVTAILTRVKL
jgi:hypothetical protein